MEGRESELMLDIRAFFSSFSLWLLPFVEVQAERKDYNVVSVSPRVCVVITYVCWLCCVLPFVLPVNLTCGNFNLFEFRGKS